MRRESGTPPRVPPRRGSSIVAARSLQGQRAHRGLGRVMRDLWATGQVSQGGRALCPKDNESHGDASTRQGPGTSVSAWHTVPLTVLVEAGGHCGHDRKQAASPDQALSARQLALRDFVGLGCSEEAGANLVAPPIRKWNRSSETFSERPMSHRIRGSRAATGLLGRGWRWPSHPTCAHLLVLY